MSIFDEPKVDCHNHIFDPNHFPYAPDVLYRPAGPELTSAHLLHQMCEAYGLSYALIVQPNSGYGLDNTCLLDAIANSDGRFKGVAVVKEDIGLEELRRLKEAGIVGVAMNTTVWGLDYYLAPEKDLNGLLDKLVQLDLFLQIQVREDEILPLLPLLERSPVRLLIDHCGRPAPEKGLEQPGFQATLELGRSGRAIVKLSGYEKFSRESYPYSDVWPFVEALVSAFTVDNCIWGSDWPFIIAPERIDYGPLLKLIERLLPDAHARRKVLYENPCRLFGFGAN